jgi:hypothetical protein
MNETQALWLLCAGIIGSGIGYAGMCIGCGLVEAAAEIRRAIWEWGKR